MFQKAASADPGVIRFCFDSVPTTNPKANVFFQVYSMWFVEFLFLTSFFSRSLSWKEVRSYLQWPDQLARSAQPHGTRAISWPEHETDSSGRKTARPNREVLSAGVASCIRIHRIELKPIGRLFPYFRSTPYLVGLSMELGACHEASPWSRWSCYIISKRARSFGRDDKEGSWQSNLARIFSPAHMLIPSVKVTECRSPPNNSSPLGRSIKPRTL